MERLCGWAIGIPMEGRVYGRVECGIYLGARLRLKAWLYPCRIQSGRPAKSGTAQRWERSGAGFVRTTTAREVGPYVWYAWQATPLPGGGCNGLDYLEGLTGHFNCRLLLRRTRSLMAGLPLRWCVKTGVAAARGVVPGARRVPPAEWRPVPEETVRCSALLSRDVRFLIVRAALVEFRLVPTHHGP